MSLVCPDTKKLIFAEGIHLKEISYKLTNILDIWTIVNYKLDLDLTKNMQHIDQEQLGNVDNDINEYWNERDLLFEHIEIEFESPHSPGTMLKHNLPGNPALNDGHQYLFDANMIYCDWAGYMSEMEEKIQMHFPKFYTVSMIETFEGKINSFKPTLRDDSDSSETDTLDFLLNAAKQIATEFGSDEDHLNSSDDPAVVLKDKIISQVRSTDLLRFYGTNHWAYRLIDPDKGGHQPTEGIRVYVDKDSYKNALQTNKSLIDYLKQKGEYDYYLNSEALLPPKERF